MTDCVEFKLIDLENEKKKLKMSSSEDIFAIQINWEINDLDKKVTPLLNNPSPVIGPKGINWFSPTKIILNENWTDILENWTDILELSFNTNEEVEKFIKNSFFAFDKDGNKLKSKITMVKRKQTFNDAGEVTGYTEEFSRNLSNISNYSLIPITEPSWVSNTFTSCYFNIAIADVSERTYQGVKLKDYVATFLKHAIFGETLKYDALFDELVKSKEIQIIGNGLLLDEGIYYIFPSQKKNTESTKFTLKFETPKSGCTDCLSKNWDPEANVDDGKCEDFGDIAGSAGDPHILTFGGNRCELPHTINAYEYLSTKDIKINIDTLIKGDEVLINNVYVKHQDSSFVINLFDLEVSNENSFNFEYHQPGELTKLFVTNDGKYRLLFNSEKNGLLIKSYDNLTQENSSGVLMSDPFDECVIDNIF